MWPLATAYIRKTNGLGKKCPQWWGVHKGGDAGCPQGGGSTVVKVRVKLKKIADLDFDLDPNWGITPKIETLYNRSCLPDTKKPKNI